MTSICSAHIQSLCLICEASQWNTLKIKLTCTPDTSHNITSPCSVPLAITSPVLEKHDGFTGWSMSCIVSCFSGHTGSGSDVTVTSSAPVIVSQTRRVPSSAVDEIRSPAGDTDACMVWTRRKCWLIFSTLWANSADILFFHIFSRK